MLRHIFLIIIFFPSVILIAQEGNGSLSDPFRGTISSSVHWTINDPNYGSVVYVGTVANPDLIIDSGGHLTVDPGITVLFTQNTSDLIITGSGRLSANGGEGPTQTIRFTRNSGINFWGHISFENMTTINPQDYPSILQNCEISYGYSPEGGGINIAFTYVTVSKCRINNNTSFRGGGILINQGDPGFSPRIENCVIRDNIATSFGGGIMVWSRSSAEIINCLIMNNSCRATSTFGGGGLLVYAATGSPKIINTTIVGNYSQFNGDNIHIYHTTGASFLNSIAWGSDKSVYITGAPNTNNFINSALQSVNGSSGEIQIATTFQNSFQLNSINNGTNPLGPYFLSPSSYNYSITYPSPCRDAGLDTYPGVTIPITDYIGNQRIGDTDIGAYEVQYSRWRTDAGSTDWGTPSNWEGGVPTSTRDIVIPTGATAYPTGASAQNVTVGSGRYFIMEPGSRATVNNLTNNGIMRLMANSSSLSSLILNSYTRGSVGTEEIQIYLTGGGTSQADDYRWHYISSPVSSLAASTFTTTTLDLAQYVESRPSTSLRQGWVAYDGYVYSSGLMSGPTFNTLTTATNGKGYNYYFNADRLYTFSGLLNSLNVSAPLGYSGNPILSGFNLLGNPFISGLNWDYIVNDPGYPANTSKGVYFTRNNEQYSYIGGVGTPGTVTGIIPPMQGFFTKTYSEGNTIVIPREARTHENIVPRYKGAGIVIPLVRVALSGADKTDETVVRFDETAKAGIDNDFDAVKMFLSETKTYLYSVTEGIKYAINGQPFPETILEIPLVLNVVSNGNHTLSAIQLQGLDNYRVKLKDLELSTLTDLKTTPEYNFTAPSGNVTNRFVLLISDLATGAETIEAAESPFNIYPYSGSINIVPLSDGWDSKSATVSLIELSGKVISSMPAVELRKDVVTTIKAPVSTGLYFVEIRSGAQKHVGKLIIK
jgi:hypothetical protein